MPLTRAIPMEMASTASPSPARAPGRGGSEPPPKETCTRPKAVQRLVFSRSKYRNIRRHVIQRFAGAGRA